MKIFRTINIIITTFAILLISVFTAEQGFPSGQLLLSIFFPIGFVLGLIIGLLKPRIGGYITVCAFLSFYIAHIILTGALPNDTLYIIFTIPGFLLLIYSVANDYLNKKNESGN
jgi:hypothetical protein